MISPGEVPVPTEAEMARAYWDAIQGHGSPADRFAGALLEEMAARPYISHRIPAFETPNEVTENLHE